MPKQTITLSQTDFGFLKGCKDGFEFHKIKSTWFRAGSAGLGAYKRRKEFVQIGHCNSFRDKTLSECLTELNN